MSATKKRKQSNAPTDVPADLPSTSGCKDSTPELAKKGVQLAGIVLTGSDEQHILDGEKLNGRHINLAQCSLKPQFSKSSRVEVSSTTGKRQQKEDDKLKIQIVRCHGDRWIAASVLAADDEVKVYGSVYQTLDGTIKTSSQT